MLTLKIFPPAFGEISGSPFSAKALCLMEMSGARYECLVTHRSDKAPKKKLPVLEHNNKIIPDSDQIRDYLEAEFSVDFDSGLSAEQKAVSRAVIRMTEENIYFAIVSSRWQTDDNWPTLRDEFFGSVPKLLKGIISSKIRKQVIAMLIGQGMGRHSPAEQVARIGKDIAAIETLLGDKPFLFGDTPTAADATVVPMLRAMAVFPNTTELTQLVQTRTALMDYIERGSDVMYPK